MRKTLLGATALLCGLTLSTLSIADTLGASSEHIATTQRRIAGEITSVDDSSMTITSVKKIGSRGVVRGRIDATKTRIMIDGHPAHTRDLNLTDAVRAEINFDEVWLSISVDRR